MMGLKHAWKNLIPCCFASFARFADGCIIGLEGAGFGLDTSHITKAVRFLTAILGCKRRAIVYLKVLDNYVDDSYL